MSCENCALGFELRSDGNCYDISDGCESIGSNFGTCEKCKKGFKLTGYRCVKDDVFVPYCYIYYNETACEICKNGYSYFQSFCLLPFHIQGILNGSTTIDATIKTIRSELGIPAKGNGTTPTPPNNNTNNNNNNNNNTNNVNINSNSNSDTGGKPSATPIPNCANQNSGLCLACNPGFVVSNNVCQQMDPNCGSYELSSGKCI